MTNSNLDDLWDQLSILERNSDSMSPEEFNSSVETLIAGMYEECRIIAENATKESTKAQVNVVLESIRRLEKDFNAIYKRKGTLH